MLISLAVVVFFIVLIILLAAGIKVEIQKGGQDVIKTVYFYLVLFATLMMTIGGTVSAFMAVADIVYPAPFYQSFEEYKQMGLEKAPADRPNAQPQLSEKELREKYDAMVVAEKERQINRAKNTLVKSLGWIVIPLPVFVYFQRKLVKKEE